MVQTTRPRRAVRPRFTIDGMSNLAYREVEAARADAPTSAPGTTGPASGHLAGNEDISMDADDELDQRPEDEIKAESEDLLRILANMRLNEHTAEAGSRHSRLDNDCMECIRQAISKEAHITRELVGSVMSYSAFPPPPANPVVERPQLGPNFTMAWGSPPSHSYNTAAAALIAKSILDDRKNVPLFHSMLLATSREKLLKIIAKQVLVSFRRFQDVWEMKQKEHTLAVEGTTEEKKQYKLEKEEKHLLAASNSRRSRLMQHRQVACTYFKRPKWTALLTLLTANAQSSDEEDKSTKGTHFIISKPWRNNDVIEFLTLLERLAAVAKKNTNASARSFRVRVVPSANVVSLREPVNCLPKELYSPEQIETFGPDYLYGSMPQGLNVKDILEDVRQVAKANNVGLY